MANEERTRFDQRLDYFRNNKWFSAFLVVIVLIIGLGTFTDSVLRIAEFFRLMPVAEELPQIINGNSEVETTGALLPQELSPVKTIIIDNRDYVRYPGAFVSLDNATVVSLPIEVLDSEISADLWIEPRDPEIAGLETVFEGAIHLGRETFVSLVNAADFEAMETVSDIQWQDRLSSDSIVKGSVFLVRSSNNNVYKVRIDEWERGDRDLPGENENVRGLGGFVQLSYAQINQ